jgi:hypothetical protein
VLKKGREGKGQEEESELDSDDLKESSEPNVNQRKENLIRT